MEEHEEQTYVGACKCPHCMTVHEEHLTPIARLPLLQCPACAKTFIISGEKTEFKTFPTAIPPDLYQ